MTEGATAIAAEEKNKSWFGKVFNKNHNQEEMYEIFKVFKKTFDTMIGLEFDNYFTPKTKTTASNLLLVHF